MIVREMTLVSFRLFRKKLGHLREFFVQMVHLSPRNKLAVRLCYRKSVTQNLTIQVSEGTGLGCEAPFIPAMNGAA